MARSDRWIIGSRERRFEDSNRQTGALAGLALSLSLVLIALILVRHLHATSVIEDCLLSGRQNCDILVSPNH